MTNDELSAAVFESALRAAGWVREKRKAPFPGDDLVVWSNYAPDVVWHTMESGMVWRGLRAIYEAGREQGRREVDDDRRHELRRALGVLEETTSWKVLIEIAEEHRASQKHWLKYLHAGLRAPGSPCPVCGSHDDAPTPTPPADDPPPPA